VRASPAFRLAAACCRPLDDPRRDEAVRAAAAGADWQSFVDVARRHRIEGLALEALARAGVEAPGPAGERLRERARAGARRSLAQAAETVRLQCALDAGGLPNLVLKGVALDMLAWRRIGLKQAWDIDLLVLEVHVTAAVRILMRAGYVLEQPADLDDDPQAWRTWVALSKECVFRNPTSDLAVELHWRLADPAGLLPTLAATSPARRIELGPTMSVRTLGAEETFAYLCVHGTCHGWSRLKWLADVAALVQPMAPEAVTALYDRAMDLGAGRCAAVAMRLTERVLGASLPPSLARETDDWRTRALVALAVSCLTGADLEGRPGLADAVRASHLLFARGTRFATAELRRQWVSVADRRRLHLPDRLEGLYHLARIPLWISRRISRRIGRRAERRGPSRPMR
jgi:hypothetical protein